ncbi:hypothetical protein FRC10_001053 [Ceratobasidium sp. 414]|nr:hypothetical protein FRC10_001053 [Ceratobasidium sp. 414]
MITLRLFHAPLPPPNRLFHAPLPPPNRLSATLVPQAGVKNAQSSAPAGHAEHPGSSRHRRRPRPRLHTSASQPGPEQTSNELPFLDASANTQGHRPVLPPLSTHSRPPDNIPPRSAPATSTRTGVLEPAILDTHNDPSPLTTTSAVFARPIPPPNVSFLANPRSAPTHSSAAVTNVAAPSVSAHGHSAALTLVSSRPSVSAASSASVPTPNTSDPNLVMQWPATRPTGPGVSPSNTAGDPQLNYHAGALPGYGHLAPCTRASAAAPVHYASPPPVSQGEPIIITSSPSPLPMELDHGGQPESQLESQVESQCEPPPTSQLTFQLESQPELGLEHDFDDEHEEGRLRDALTPGGYRAIFTELSNSVFQGSRDANSLRKHTLRLLGMYKDIVIYGQHHSLDFDFSDEDRLLAQLTEQIQLLRTQGINIQIHPWHLLVFVRCNWFYWMHARLRDHPVVRTYTDTRSGRLSPPPPAPSRFNVQPQGPQQPPPPPCAPPQPRPPSSAQPTSAVRAGTSRGKGRAPRPPQANPTRETPMPPPPPPPSVRGDTASISSSHLPSVSSLRVPRNPSSGRVGRQALSAGSAAAIRPSRAVPTSTTPSRTGPSTHGAPPAPMPPGSGVTSNAGRAPGHSVAPSGLTNHTYSEADTTTSNAAEMARHQKYFNKESLFIRKKSADTNRRAMEIRLQLLEWDADGQDEERGHRMQLAERDSDGTEREREHRMHLANEQAVLENVGNQVEILTESWAFEHNMLLATMNSLQPNHPLYQEITDRLREVTLRPRQLNMVQLMERTHARFNQPTAPPLLMSSSYTSGSRSSRSAVAGPSNRPDRLRNFSPTDRAMGSTSGVGRIEDFGTDTEATHLEHAAQTGLEGVERAGADEDVSEEEEEIDDLYD